MGPEVFKLYDTFGLPVDFVQEMANERNFEVDLAGFEEEMEKQRKAARAAWKGDVTFEAQEVYRTLSGKYSSVFTGYSTLEEPDCEILQLISKTQPVAVCRRETGEVILNRTPFMRNRRTDGRSRRSGSGLAQVTDTSSSNRPDGSECESKGLVATGRTRSRPNWIPAIGPQNHTATHLLHDAAPSNRNVRRRDRWWLRTACGLTSPLHRIEPEDVRGLEKEVNERVCQSYGKHQDQPAEERRKEPWRSSGKIWKEVRVVTIGDLQRIMRRIPQFTEKSGLSDFVKAARGRVRRIQRWTGLARWVYSRKEN
jgi:alanyl-tRNA synthetase